MAELLSLIPNQSIVKNRALLHTIYKNKVQMNSSQGNYRPTGYTTKQIIARFGMKMETIPRYQTLQRMREI